MDNASEIARVVSPKEVALRMKIDYSRGVKDQITKDLDGVCGLCWRLEKPNLNVNSFIRETAELITKLFGIESVAVGVRDPADRLYKYRAVVGLDKELEDGYGKLSYTREQLFSASTYPSYDISDHTKLFLAEDHPYAEGEEFTYRRPGLIGMKRRSLTDSLEADYLDILFFGPDGEVLGFIEISPTRMRKLPDTLTIKWIELIGGILGVAVQNGE